MTMNHNILPHSNSEENQNTQYKQLAHDLRNALSSILLYTEILEASLSKLSLEEEIDTTRLINDSVKEMDALIVERFR